MTECDDLCCPSDQVPAGPVEPLGTRGCVTNYSAQAILIGPQDLAGLWVDQMNASASGASYGLIMIAVLRSRIINEPTLDVQLGVRTFEDD